MNDIILKRITSLGHSFERNVGGARKNGKLIDVEHDHEDKFLVFVQRHTIDTDGMKLNSKGAQPV